MNLITRIILLFALISMLVFLVGGVISYRVMKREVDAEQRRFLNERLERCVELIGRRPPDHTVNRNQMVIEPFHELREETIAYSDTVVMHSQLERLEPHLKLTAIRNVNGKSYAITIYGVVVEADDIQEAVTESLTKTYLILLGMTLLVGGIVSYLIFKPFRATLEVIRKFSIKDPEDSQFPKSSVSEFKKLNIFLEEMTGKVKKDYATLKEFSENASHELQTPLAIAQTKLELLLNSDNLSEEQINQIMLTQSALKRLSKLSSSLGVLTKIENQEFDQISSVHMKEILTELLDEFAELITLKGIELTCDVNENVEIRGDISLIELMVSNLINNAIRHNVEGGFIHVTLSKESLIVQNSGLDLNMNPELLFERFKKSNQTERSTGLGLAIVKQICELYSFNVSYEQRDEKHKIQIKF